MTTLYAVVDMSGELIARDLTTEQAAHVILTQDSQEYDIRPDGNYWKLWTRQQVANKPWTATIMCAGRTAEAEARADIFAHVVNVADGGRHWMAEAIPQEDWDEMQAQLAEEAGE